ncbi:MAG: hypothetical protein IJK54_07735 [Clostridia bacterium]|nr:hypothetical protein [Clostridia bacterium]
MKQGKKQKKQKKHAVRTKRTHPKLKFAVAIALPVIAIAIAAVFVLLCLTYGGVKRTLTIELGTITPEASAFLRGETGEAAYETEPEEFFRQAGDYPLRVLYRGRAVQVVLHVRDTQPPTAEGPEQTVPAGTALTPDKLIKNLRDKSRVKITYEAEPDFFTVGDYEAAILLEDESGNAARVPVTVHVRTAVDEITVEAGDPAPTAEEILIAPYADVSITPITDAMLREPGDYTLSVTADGIASETRLVVKDTVPPKGKGVTYIARPGETIRPGMLVTDVSDETAVSAALAAQPDPKSLEPQTIPVTLTDRGGNETTVWSTLLFTNISPVVIEARHMGLSPSELLEDGTYTEASFDMQFIPDELGQHVLAVTIDGERNIAVIEVRDTTPPSIAILRPQWYLNTPIAVDALAEAEDVTETELSYLTEPDWTKDEQEVTVVATDTSGNRSEKTFTLTLIPDTEPPELYGVRSRYCYLGEPVAYLAEVYAWDDCDGDVAVSVDASGMDITQAGDYYVTYSATDRCGNTASKAIVMHVVRSKVDEDRAQEVADEIIAKILTDDMSLAEQVAAIYDYVFTNVRYAATSNKQDWRGEAVRGLTIGRGDCFTSYAAARLLLEQTDAQIVSVQRSQPNTHHYWLLVNVGTGWYHFDACNQWTGKYRCFMWTDEQTRFHSRSYWRYDPTLYPPVATTPYKGGN